MALFLGDISRFFKAGLNTRLARLKALGAAHRRKCNRQNAKGTQKVHGKNQRLQLTENKSLEVVIIYLTQGRIAVNIAVNLSLCLNAPTWRRAS